jgi:hypothetical protein
MISFRSNHHEAALSLLQQLILTGSLVIPSGITIAKGLAAKHKTKKGKLK